VLLRNKVLKVDLDEQIRLTVGMSSHAVLFATAQRPDAPKEWFFNSLLDIAASSNHLCLLNSDQEIRVLDITTPAQPITGATLAGRVSSQQFGCVRAPIAFSASTNFPNSTTFRWQAEVPFNSGNYINLSDFTASTYTVSGAFTDTLTFTPLPGGRLADNLHTRYRVVATSACGSTTSTAGRLDLCSADFNCDSLVDLFDYLDCVNDFASLTPSSDFNADGFIDFFDYLDFVDAFAIGC
jgi:hypothetical protein